MPKTPSTPPAEVLLSALPESLQPLARQGIVRVYRPGSVLIEEGTYGDTLYVMLKGAIKAFSSDDRGREIIFGVYGPGEYVGEMSLDGGPRSVSIVTLETTTCALISRATLRAHLTTHPDFAFELIERVIRRVRVLTESARGLALLDVYGRLVKLLNTLAVVTDDGLRTIRPRPTHIELAGRIGSSREMVSRLMKDLELGGYVVSSAGQFVLSKPLPSSW